MQILSKRNFLSGHKVKNLDFCEHCVSGKLLRSKFPKKGVHRTKGTLDYIHMDCWVHNVLNLLDVTSILC